MHRLRVMVKKIKKAVGHVNLATGEACSGRVMFKQFLEIGAINICQIDSCRLGSINEILTVLLMAHKLNIPVFPHAGGVGLCEYVQHICMIDYILIIGEKDNKVVEYAKKLKLYAAQFTVSTPLPGTPFYEDMMKDEKIVNKDLELLDNNTMVFNHENLTNDQIHNLKEEAFLRYYFRPRFIMEQLRWKTRELFY